MRIWTLRLTAVFILGALVGAGAMFSWRPAPCSASFREVAPQGIEVDLGSRQFGVRASLIGCTEALSGINAEEMGEIAQLIKDLLREDNWMMWPKSMRQDYREDLTRRVNSALGRRSVSDVHLYGFSAAE